MKELITATFMGAPSTGKTSLCEALASQHQTLFMPEYGKLYWKEHQVNRRLSLDQLTEIAEGHHQLEDEMRPQARKYLFVDTNAITTYTFSIDYYNKASEKLSVLAKEAEHRYDLYFLCDIDIPYEDSWERSGDQHRKDFQKMIIEDLNNRGVDYQVLSGSLEERMNLVNEAVVGNG